MTERTSFLCSIDHPTVFDDGCVGWIGLAIGAFDFRRVFDDVPHIGEDHGGTAPLHHDAYRRYVHPLLLVRGLFDWKDFSSWPRYLAAKHAEIFLLASLDRIGFGFQLVAVAAGTGGHLVGRVVVSALSAMN